MNVKQLLEGLSGCELRGPSETRLTGVSAHSKCLAPGNLFISKRGKEHDGTHYIREAIRAGASAIAVDRFHPDLPETTQIIHPNVASIESALAAAYYGHPSRELLMVGITGTNGKTTTAFLVKQLLDRLLGSCGLIGTLGYLTPSKHYPPTHTTPDISTNQRLLREMADQGCCAAVMEVSSHALDQGRVDGLDFDAAIFSNLTLDHLDYHGSIERYAAAKKKLFNSLGKGEKRGAKALINQDSPWASYMMEGSPGVIGSYGIEKEAELQASSIHFDRKGTHVRLAYRGRNLDCFWPLIGRFNVYNCLAAIALCLEFGIPLEEVAERLPLLSSIPGRLQPVENERGRNIYVDFAHTDDALLKALDALREVKGNRGRLIVVFGCGGDRDPSKRPKMARACESAADFSIVTSDNPRSEDPQKICQEAAAGFQNPGLYCIEADRREAIRKAIEMAQSEDLILIAGKGHETQQIFADRSIPFDDARVAAELCAPPFHPLRTL